MVQKVSVELDIIDNLIKNSAGVSRQFGEHLKTMETALQRLDRSMATNSASSTNLLGVFDRLGKAAQTGGNTAGGAFRGVATELGIMAGGAFAGYMALQKLEEGFTASVQAAREMKAITRTLEFAAGGARAGAEEFAFLTAETNRLGISLQASAHSYASMAAAAHGTSLQGKATRDVFTAVAEASTVMGLTAEQTDGAMTALTQMISKGKVEAEELRGQLGERLPGAFNIAARAMGMTTAELDKMMANGQLFTEDFLPKFAEALHESVGGAAVKASSEAQQSIQRLENEMFSAASGAGSVFVGVMGAAAKAILAVKDASDAANAARGNAVIAGLPRDVTAQVKALEEGLRLAKEAKALEDQKAAGPSNKQQAAIKEMEKEAAKQAKKDAEEAKKNAAEQLRVDEAAGTNREKREAKFANAVKERERRIADQKYDNARKLQAATIEAEKTVRDNQASTMRPGFDKQRAELDAHRQDDLDAFNKSENAKTLGFMQAEIVRTSINKKYAEQRKSINRAESQSNLQVTGGVLTALGSLMETYAGKNKAQAKAAMRVTEAGALASTAAGVMHAWGDEGNGNFYTRLAESIIVGVAGATQIMKIEQAMGSFADGGYTGPGARLQPRGIVHANEYVVPSSTVNGMGGPGGVEAALYGTGPTLHAPINITIQGDASANTVKQIGTEVNRHLRGMQRNIEMAKRRNIRG